ncbi:plastocyanin/azurin family copper-binding protein [Candidatus Nanosalina sp. VS9-1]|uniref:plastocyanin/azurin family copper-binding protein n=1 Tax=Candidatus Nanosalina sp. VS9-1 TaxID=3388566 RepID=UPI0039E1A5A2
MKKSYFLMIVLGAVLVTSGCASTTDSPVENPANSSEASSEVNRTIQVNGGNFYFESDDIEVEAGQTVRFVFVNDGGTHDMRIPSMNAGTEIISGGESESFTVTFDEEGEIEFICSVGNHAEQGMTGTITVT